MYKKGSKNFMENVAILSLKKYCEDLYKPGFKKAESPDWQNKKYNIGVEVSQILHSSEARIKGEKILGKSINEILKNNSDKLTKETIDSLKKYENYNLKEDECKFIPFKFNDNIDKYELSCGIAITKGHTHLYFDDDKEIFIDKLYEIYLKKAKKLNKNYNNFNLNILYLFFNYFINLEYQVVFSLIKRAKYNIINEFGNIKLYDYVFIDTIDKIFMFNKDNFYFIAKKNNITKDIIEKSKNEILEI